MSKSEGRSLRRDTSQSGVQTIDPVKSRDKELSASWGEYRLQSARRLNDVLRQLAIGGFAGIWVLTPRATLTAPLIPSELLVAAILLVTALSIDLIHGLFDTAIAYHIRQYYKDRASRSHRTSRIALWLNRHRLTSVLFCAKFVAMALAFVLIVHFALGTLQHR